MLRVGFLIIWGVLLGLNFKAIRAEETIGKGSLEVVHKPIVCVTTPCPQYKVLKINGVVPDHPLGADLVNFDSTKSAVRQFKTFTVVGEWKAQDNYLEVTVSEWKVTLSETLDVPAKKTESVESPSLATPGK